MANRAYSYQYETSPRKLEPEYKRPVIKKKTVTKKTTSNTKKQPKKATKAKKKKKIEVSFETKFFLNSMLIFALVFTVIAFQALVEQRYKEKETLKQKYNELLASSNIAVDVDNDVRRLASEYGMQTKSATLIDLGTSDYIECSEDVVQIEEENIFTKLIKWFEEIF